MARTISTSLVPIPNASAPNAPWVDGVRIAAHDRHPGLGQPELRSDDVDDALARVADAVERDPELGAVGLELVDLGERHLVDERQAAIGRRDRVVGGRDGLAGAAHADAAGAQPGEGLRAGDFVDEVEVDGQDGGRTRVLGHDVVVPDLVDDGARAGAVIGRAYQSVWMGAGTRKERPEGRSQASRIRVGGDPSRTQSQR